MLLLALIIPFWGSYLVFHIKIEHAHNNVEKDIAEAKKEGQLIVLSFLHDEISTSVRWIKDYEFEYQGRMYDVVDSGSDDKHNWFLCYYHAKETKLRNQLSEIVAGLVDHNPVNNDKMPNLKIFLNNLIFQKYKLRLLNSSKYKALLANYSQEEKTGFLKRILPPPQKFA